MKVRKVNNGLGKRLVIAVCRCYDNIYSECITLLFQIVKLCDTASGPPVPRALLWPGDHLHADSISDGSSALLVITSSGV